MTRKFALLICLALFAGVAFAHGNLQHVMGTVTKISQDSLTVQTTAKATVEVQIVSETTFTKGNASASVNDVHIGDRVVIHAMPVPGGKLMAHTVQVGVSKAPTPSH